MWFLLAFLALPIVEIAVFIWVGGLIGVWPTLALVVTSAFAGVAVIRAQGLQAFARLRRSVEQGGGRLEPIAHHGLIVVAGVLLLIPGFFTDAVALLLLIPPVRTLLMRWGASRLAVRAAAVVPGRPRPPAGDVIDADYRVVEEDRPARGGRSGWTRPQP